MEPVEVLLSEQFVEFSTKVQEIAAAKKKLKADFKEVYDKYQTDCKSLDESAMQAQTQFEEWKKTVVKK